MCVKKVLNAFVNTPPHQKNVHCCENIWTLKDRFHRLEEKLRQIEWKNQWKPARGCEQITHTNY